MKKCLAVFMSFLFLLHPFSVCANEKPQFYPPAYEVFEEWTQSASFTGDLECKASLLMEASTGRILYQSNENEELPIASVTKIMSTLLVCEAIDKGKIKIDDMVTVSAYAASMGGSQVYLEPGEQMSVDEMLKCLIVASANDAAVALAEHIYGSVESFVAAMNTRAEELGMEHTLFANTTGLDEDGGGYSSALDVALMTRELLKHPIIFNYTTIWMDTVRDGAFGLSNTNRLVRFYQGANGMKTGFTTEAMYCVSATALRDGMQLIAVVLGSPSSDKRFASAKQMLDFGFANYRVVQPEAVEIPPLTVKGGCAESFTASYIAPSILAEKGGGEIVTETRIEENLKAPIAKGQKVGEAIFLLEGEELCRADIRADSSVEKLTFNKFFKKIWKNILSFV